MAIETRISELSVEGEHKIIFINRTTVDINANSEESLVEVSRASYAPNVDVSSLEQEIIDLAAENWTSEVVSSYNELINNLPKNEIEL